MIDWIQRAEEGIRELAGIVPLEVFVFFGAFVEEVFAPIPSMLIMTTAGVFARFESHTPFFLIWLVALGNCGKIIGSILYYKIGDKAEDIFIGRFGRLLGIRQEDAERFGARFTGHPLRDGTIIFFLRLIPFFPSIVVSLAAGIVRLRFRAFVIGSFAGNFCKDTFYIFAGYYGATVLRTFFLEIERVRWGIGILVFLVTAGALAVLYVYRHESFRALNRIIDFFKTSQK